MEKSLSNKKNLFIMYLLISLISVLYNRNTFKKVVCWNAILTFVYIKYCQVFTKFSFMPGVDREHHWIKIVTYSLIDSCRGGSLNGHTYSLAFIINTCCKSANIFGYKSPITFENVLISLSCYFGFNFYSFSP